MQRFQEWPKRAKNLKMFTSEKLLLHWRRCSLLEGIPIPPNTYPFPLSAQPSWCEKKPTGLPVRSWFGLGAEQSSKKLKGELLETRELWKSWDNMLRMHSWLAAEQHGAPQGAQAKLKAWGDLLISCKFERIFNPYAGWAIERGSFIVLSCQCITAVEIIGWSDTREIPQRLRQSGWKKPEQNLSSLQRNRFFILSLGKFIIY